MKDTTYKMTDLFSPMKEVEQINLHSLETFLNKYSGVQKDFDSQIQNYEIKLRNTLHNTQYKKLGRNW